jgi:hypothetical protein
MILDDKRPQRDAWHAIAQARRISRWGLSTAPIPSQAAESMRFEIVSELRRAAVVTLGQVPNA